MRFCLLESLCDIRHLGPLAIAAENAGFDALAIPESIFIVGFRNVYDPVSRNMTLQQKIDLLQGYAENVISAFRRR